MNLNFYPKDQQKFNDRVPRRNLNSKAYHILPAYTDLKKAFDEVEHGFLMKKVLSFGIGGNVRKLIDMCPSNGHISATC